MLGSLNTFGGSPPKQEWLRSFFDEPQEFLSGHELSRGQIYSFGRFLRDANLLMQKDLTSFVGLVKNFGWDREAALGLMLVNLVAANVQIRWFIENLPLEKRVSRMEVEAKLLSAGVTKNSARTILRSFGRLSRTAFGFVLRFVKVTYVRRRLEMLMRTKARMTDGRVILYALYKFAEECDTRQFTLSELMGATASPAKIFGLSVEELEQFLNGLSADYPEFLDATFTHDLEKISLMTSKNAADVLKLFEV